MKGEKRKTKNADINARDCRLRGVYDLFWKMVPQKTALNTERKKSYTETKTRTHTRKHDTHTSTYVSNIQAGKGKRERANRQMAKCGRGREKNLNDKYTHKQKKSGRKDWMKIISNYLGRRKRERKKMWRKRK